MAFITQHPLNINVKQKKLSFSINGGMSNYNGGVGATTESQLSMFLSLANSIFVNPLPSNLLSSNLLSTNLYFAIKKIFIQEVLYDLPSQDNLVVSNHHSNTHLKAKLR
jgi:hypothetical protein